MKSVTNFFEKRKLKRIIRSKRTNAIARADALYDYMRIVLNNAAGKQGINAGEYEIMTSMMLGNVISHQTNRGVVNESIARVVRLGRELRSEYKRKEGKQ